MVKKKTGANVGKMIDARAKDKSVKSSKSDRKRSRANELDERISKKKWIPAN